MIIKKQEKVYLMILDGFGIGKKYPGNAIEKANMPNYSNLLSDYPNTKLIASGNEVGLPKKVMGNSEVGHFTIGAGRISYQSLELINKSISDKSFYKNKILLTAIKKAKTTSTPLHLLGMISDEGVHSHINHLFALIDMAVKNGVKEIFIHAITDGRDVAERSAAIYIKKINRKIKSVKKAKVSIATIIGRYYAMDRDNNWNRTQIAYDLLTKGKGTKETDAIQSLANEYEHGTETDYYIKPIILNPEGIIKNKQSVIFFNFRTDRPRQLTHLFTGEKKGAKVRPNIVCFGEYSDKAPIVFTHQPTKNNLPETLEKNKKTQLHVAETEKFAHVTFFFNSQSEKQYSHEKRILIKSPKVPSYDEKPEMSAREITNKVIKEVSSNKFDFIIQNFANPDLVGHSGNLIATIKACEIIDECIGKITKATLKNDYHLIIIADHGNAEYMIYEESGDQCPSHTLNPVPCILVSKKYKSAKLRGRMGLKDIAPTILEIMNIKKPKEMEGKTLIK